MIAIDFNIKPYQVKDVNVKVQIWDYKEYSGTKFKTNRLSYYRGIKNDIQGRMGLLYVST